ncbi:hypothetical protein KAR91_41290 [Candidatus Pacearchaeota archaeon]|nr:hypothetical protein [Candidatus Pacearchaeota archaeon]
MASTIPEQYRAVDPFASYNSNTVNQLSEIRSRAENVLDIPCGLDVVIDSTSPLDTVIVKPGYAFKDDIIITVTEDHTVDFNDTDQYISFDIAEIIAGYYYIVLEYTYVKSRPAPQARIKIVAPDQRNNYDYGSSSTSLVFLKAVLVSSVGPIVITSVHDYDPTITDNKREFAKRYAGSVTNLPTHAQCRDQGRFAYDIVADEFWFGYEDRWERLNVSGTFNIDTENVTIGDLCYVDANGQAALADSTSVVTAAEMVAIEIGLAANGTGQARLNGYVQNVNVEAGSPGIIVGDLLYLSNSEPGTVTSTRPSPLYQVVGRALTVEAASKVDILFFGRAVLETTTTARVTDTLTGADWVLDAGSYRGDVDITGLAITGQDVIVSCRDTADDMVIAPQDIELSVADTVRIWMPVNTVTLVVAVVG